MPHSASPSSSAGRLRASVTAERGQTANVREAIAPRTGVTAAAVPFVARLGEHGDRVALVDDVEALTYRELSARVDSFGARLGEGRRLVLVAGANSVQSVVAYLAVLARGHVCLLASNERPEQWARLIATYDPDVVVSADTDWEPKERRSGSVHALHPSLALVLSTSGTTGSQRLVRLSRANLQSNAEAIVEALGLKCTDRAATTLPLHYCYGLSVVHSHLQCGGSLYLTTRSVVEPALWEACRARGVTNFAGVPHTFELLGRVGLEAMALPSLRLVTQAGGRLAPEQVRNIATFGRGQGWDLFVMYGQTEATARMAVLPATLALTQPASVGRAIPGGRLELVPADGCVGPDEGELVYRGPNVMLGYAEGPEDLRRGATVEALSTGDLARRGPDGTFEIIGRRSRFVKPFGLRVDLDEVERSLARQGLPALCTGDDRRLVVAVEHGADEARTRQLLAQELGLPAGRIQIASFEVLPRLPSGKPDYAAVLRATSTAVTVSGIGDVYARALGVDTVSHADTFVGLGGDSLSYVEVALHLERQLGRLPEGWPQRTVGELERLATTARRGGLSRLDIGVFLRAVSMLFVVSGHVTMFQVMRGSPDPSFSLLGGAHVLLAVSGYNFARFLLPGASDVGGVSLRILRSAARIAVPSLLWMFALMETTGQLRPANLLLLNHALGPKRVGPLWYYWYIETIVPVLVLLAALFSLRFVRRLEARSPFVFATVLLVPTLVPRFLYFDQRHPFPSIFSPQYIAWMFCVGWVAQRARGWSERLVATLVVLLTVPAFFGLMLSREAAVAVGMLLLVWVREVPLPALAGRAFAVIAEASLYIYLTHFVVLEALVGRVHPTAAFAVALALGVATNQLVRQSLILLRAATRVARSGRLHHRPPTGAALHLMASVQGVAGATHNGTAHR